MPANFLRRWLPLAAAVTVLAAMTFGIAQQVLRSDANDPQVQLAEDAAARVAAGVPATEVVPSVPVDIAASLAPWVIVYGPDRNPLPGADSALLDGKPADYPASVLGNVQPGGGRDEVTWQPRPGVRAATVVVAFKGGWVVSGRSLRLVEERESAIMGLSVAGWLAALAATAITVLVTGFLPRRREAG
jgi:hypothetical protein